ncbi:aspartate kinase [Patescibacteria group bacterium]
MVKSKVVEKGDLIVQKYGGTSVDEPDKINTIAKHIKSYHEQGYRLIIIVSAMGKETDRLINLSSGFINPPQREVDQLLQTGEVVSASMMAMALHEIDVPAISLSAAQIGLVTTEHHGGAKIKKLRNKATVEDLLKEKVIVVTGFQGVAENGHDITTLGRGGSDATAVAIAAFLNAYRCEIYTDVDGVYAIDPRLIPDAIRFSEISYEQMLTMAASGAGVLMDRSVKIAQAHNVVMRVLLSPSIGKSDGGTLVTTMENIEDLEHVAYLCGVAIKDKICGINILDVPNKPMQAARIFESIKAINIIEDAQVQGENTAPISILLENKDFPHALTAIKKLENLKIQTSENLVAITVIDPLMKETPGYSYRITKSLGQAGVNIEVKMTSQISITVAIKKESLPQAALALAQEFNLINPK